MKTKKNKHLYETKNQWWDEIKTNIKEKAIERAKEIKAEKRNLIESLEREIEIEILKPNKNSGKIKSLKKEAYELKYDGGVFVRKKQGIREEGKIPSKALFHMEKNSQTKKWLRK